MADDLQLDLTNYRLQLQQVEAALELDKDNEDLLALKTQLNEVIGLTLTLLGKGKDDEKEENVEKTTWEKGDKCLGMWSQDRQYYRAVIDEVLDDGSCQLTFIDYGNTDICPMPLLKTISSADAAAPSALDTPAARKRKRDERVRAVEQKRRKAVKKKEKQVEIEKACEVEKNRWLDFNKKMMKQGKTKKSIFATPESVNGKVGVGTCGVSGKPMTKFDNPHKYVKK